MRISLLVEGMGFLFRFRSSRGSFLRRLGPGQGFFGLSGWKCERRGRFRGGWLLVGTYSADYSKKRSNV